MLCLPDARGQYIPLCVSDESWPRGASLDHRFMLFPLLCIYVSKALCFYPSTDCLIPSRSLIISCVDHFGFRPSSTQ